MTLRQSIWMFAILTALAGCDRPSDAVGQNAQPETATEGSSDGASSTPALDRIRERLETPDPDDMIVIAHRACWHEGPENSIAAIRACIDMGVEVIEIDVHRSRDGVLVVLHDESVDRMTNGSGRVDALSAAEIGALRLRAGAGGEQAALTDHRIPTLREVFEATRGETVFNLDTKGEVILDTIALVREMGVARQALFKTALPPTDPVVKAMDLPEGSYFMPVVRESAGSLADHVASFA
ncbi:MAG: glycerophosphodiester phosphodiesterase family protein, partial [Sphingomonadales bacterium]